MIQIDTLLLETGQTTPPRLRSDTAGQTDEVPIEFAQVWSQISEADSEEPALPKFAESQIADQSDAGVRTDAAELDMAEVPQASHLVEMELIKPDTPRATLFANADTPIPLLIVHTESPASQPLTAAQVTAPKTLNGKDAIDQLQASPTSANRVSPIKTIEVSISEPEDTLVPNVQTPASNKADVNSAVPVQPETAAQLPPVETRTVPRGTEGKYQGREAQPLLSPPQSMPQITVGDQNIHVQRLLTDVPPNTVQNMTEAAKPAVQAPLPIATREPKQAAVKTQATSPYMSLPVQEQPNAPQPASPFAPTQMPSLKAMPLPQSESSNVPLNANPKVELAAVQPTQVNVANAPTAASSAPQHHAPQIVSQIVAAITQSSGNTTDILLNPEELGRVRISLTHAEAGMTVNILTERFETADLMRRHIELLERELRDMGYDNPSFTFGERSDDSNDSWESDSPKAVNDDPSSATEDLSPSMHVTLTGGLDLKL